MTYKLIKTEKQNSISIITLNQKSTLNAISTPLLEEIVDALDENAKDNEIACVILCGSDGFFSAGIDVKEREGQDFVSLLTDDSRFELWKKIANFEKPLIAGVSGYVVGGGLELALLCDIVIASDSAKFAMPEISIASLPESGAIKRLIFAIGRPKAMEMLMTGRNMNAIEAEKSGLVSRIVPVDYLMTDIIEVAKRISEQSTVAIKIMKKASKNAYDMNSTEAMEAERMLFKAAISTEDAKEGIKAFIEKRAPVYLGK